MRSSSLIAIALVLGMSACKKKEADPAIVQALEHSTLSDVPNRSKTVDLTCWSDGVKIFEGRAEEPIVVRGERVFHFRVPGPAEHEGIDRYVRVTGDCVATYTARRE